MIYLIVLVFLFVQTSLRGNVVLTTLYAIELQASILQIGIIVALAAFFPMFFAVYAGRVSDRIGFRYPLIFGSFGVSLALLLPYLIKGQLLVLYFSQALFGLAFIFLLVNVQNLVGTISSSDNRSQNYAIYSLGISTAGILGPLIAGFSIDHIGYSLTYLVLSMMAIVPGLVIILGLFKLPKIEKKEIMIKNDILDLIKIKELRKAYIISAIILTGVGIYQFYLPIYGKNIGFSASMIGMILSVNAAAFFVVRTFMPALIKKFGDEYVLISSLVVAAVGFVFIPFFHGFVVLAIISFVIGLGLGCGQPLSIVMSFNSSPLGRTGEVLGLRLTVNKIVQFSVPIIFGTVGTIFGFYTIFMFNSFLLFSGSVYISLYKINEYLKFKANTKT